MAFERSAFGSYLGQISGYEVANDAALSGDQYPSNCKCLEGLTIAQQET